MDRVCLMVCCLGNGEREKKERKRGGGGAMFCGSGVFCLLFDEISTLYQDF